MRQRHYKDIVGNALGMYYPGQRVAFGGDVADPAAAAAMASWQAGGGAAPVAPSGWGGGGGWGPYGQCNPFGFAPWQGGDPSLAMNGIAAKNSVVVGENCGPVAVDMPLPFPATPIAEGETVVINVTPQMLYTPTSLCIPSNVASSVVVNNITIGTASQFAAIGPLPGLMFIESATYKGITFDTCLPNQPIQIEIENVSTGDIPLFYAGFEGKGVRGFGPRIFGQYPR